MRLVEMNAFGIDIDERAVCIFRESVSKRDALNRLVDAVAEVGQVSDCEAFRTAIYEREAVQSTGIGGGVAIPHVRIDQVLEPTLGIGVCRDGIDFGSLDNEPVHVIVLFAMSSGAHKRYLRLLAQAMIALRNTKLRERLTECNSPEEVNAVLNACCV